MHPKLEKRLYEQKRTQLPEAQNVESTAAHCNVIRYDLMNSCAALRLQGEAVLEAAAEAIFVGWE
jgi:hypothetical protein